MLRHTAKVTSVLSQCSWQTYSNRNCSLLLVSLYSMLYNTEWTLWCWYLISCWWLSASLKNRRPVRLNEAKCKSQPSHYSLSQKRSIAWAVVHCRSLKLHSHVWPPESSSKSQAHCSHTLWSETLPRIVLLLRCYRSRMRLSCRLLSV